MLRQKSIGMSPGRVGIMSPAGEGQAGRVTVYRRNGGALECSFLLSYMTAVPSLWAKSSGFVVGQNWL